MRFQERVYPEIFRVTKGSNHTFWVEYAVGREKEVPFTLPLPAVRLVKIEMPPIHLDPEQPRRLEILPQGGDEHAAWEQWVVEGFGVDGRVRLRSILDPGIVEWRDLSECRYRWLVPHAIAQ